MTSNVVPADDDLVERLRTCRVACAAGPAYDWLHPNKTTIALVEESADRIASLSSELARCRNVLDWFGTQTRLELSHHSPVYCDDGDQSVEWRVHEQRGSINDREWELVGRGETPFAAITDAFAALNPIGEEGAREP